MQIARSMTLAAFLALSAVTSAATDIAPQPEVVVVTGIAVVAVLAALALTLAGVVVGLVVFLRRRAQGEERATGVSWRARRRGHAGCGRCLSGHGVPLSGPRSATAGR